MDTKRAAQLVALRNEWMGASEMARALNLNRSTLWAREQSPGAFSDAFWREYAAALREKIRTSEADARRAQQAIDALLAWEGMSRMEAEPVTL